MMKRIFGFLAAAIISLPAFSDISAEASATGYTANLNLTAIVRPTQEFLGNGSKIWLAVVRGSDIVFIDSSRGGFAFTGADAPHFQAISSAAELITMPGWNTSGLIGTDIYVGYGTSFSDMVNNARFKKIYTVTDIAPKAFATNSVFYCNQPYLPYLTTTYAALKFTLTNQTNYAIGSIVMNVSLSVPGKPIPITTVSSYSIPGGLAAGGVLPLNLQPNQFSDFAIQSVGFCAQPTTLTVTITSATDAAGVVHNY